MTMSARTDRLARSICNEYAAIVAGLVARGWQRDEAHRYATAWWRIRLDRIPTRLPPRPAADRGEHWIFDEGDEG